MREFDVRQYWAQVSEDQKSEVARYAGDVFVLQGSPVGFLPDELYRIGRRVTLVHGAVGWRRGVGGIGKRARS